MPLARFYLYAQGVDIWAAPTLATGDGWVTTLRHIAREGRLLRHRGQPLPARRPDPGRLPPPGAASGRAGEDDDRGSSRATRVIVGPNGDLLAGPARHAETILTAEVDLAAVHAARRLFDPVGHYHRPDVFRLSVDTRPRPVVSLEDAHH